MSDETSISSPYLGPRPFERSSADRARFFGRDREVQEIVSLIFGHPIVLVYAQSGAGKTSIFNAGVTINLEENGFEVLPLTRVRGVTPHDINLSTSNIYTFNALQSLEPDTDPGILAQWTLAAYLEQRPRSMHSTRRKSPRVLIFDQFEELFTSYPERQHEQQVTFFRQVVEALDRDRLLRVVFVIREDYLAQLDPFAHLLPESLRIRFRLERLRTEAALLAVLRPLASTPRRFASGVAESLVKELLRVRTADAQGEIVEIEGQHVEPVQLQVVCLRLWSSLPPDATLIDASHVHAFGDVDEALARFYEESIATTARITGVHEGDLRTWFEHHLITPNGMRSTVYRGTERTGGLPNQAVDLLQNLHLIRGEWRAGAHWYELTHDRFVKPIQNSNEAWLSERREAEQARRRLESRAYEWVRLGRGAGGLLDEVELREAERWLAVLDEAHLGYAAEVSQLVDASRVALEAEVRAAEEARRRELDQARALAEAEHRRAEAQAADARRLRRLSVVLGLVILLAVGAASFAWGQQQAAERRRVEAVEARNLAEGAEATAVAAEATAVAERTRAENSANEALVAQSRAEAERERAEARLREANALRLAAAAINVLETDPQLSMLLALQAVEVATFDNAVSPPEVESVLHRAVQSSRVRLVWDAHKGSVRAIVYSRNGLWLATAGDDGATRIWDAFTGEELYTFLHDDAVYDLDLSPDGTRLLTQDRNGVIRLWDRVTGEILWAEPVGGGVTAAAINPNGELVATSEFLDDTKQSKIVLRDINTGLPLPDKTWESGAERHSSIAFSPNGKLLATAGNDGGSQVWDIETKEKRPSISGHSQWLNTIVFDPTGTRLATAGGDKLIKVWDLATNRAVLLLAGHTNSVNKLAFSPSGSHLVSVSYDGSVRVWELSAGKELFTLSGEAAALFGVAFRPDGAEVATAGSDGTVAVWDVSRPEAGSTLAGHLELVNDVAFSPDGSRLATASNDNTARIWDATTGDLEFTLKHTAWVQSVAFSPDGEQLASAGGAPSIEIWGVKTGERRHTFSGHTDAVARIKFSPDGTQLASADGTGAVRLWSVASDSEVLTLDGHTAAVFDIAFSSDGNYLATVSHDETLRIWEVASGSEVASREVDDTWYTAVAFILDSKQLVAATRHNTVDIFSVDRFGESETWEPEITLRGHKGAVFDIDLCSLDISSRPSSLIATASDDGTVKIWDTQNGKELFTLARYSGAPRAVAFSPQCDRLAIAGHDSLVHLVAVGVDPDNLLAQARQRLMRTFTPQECNAHLDPLAPGDCERSDPSPLNWLIQGRMAARQGALQDAINAFQKAQSGGAVSPLFDFDAKLEASRIAVDVHLSKAQMLAHMGDLDGARQSFKAAEEIASSIELALGDAQKRTAVALFGEGWSLGQERRWDIGIPLMETAFALGYDDAIAHYMLGVAFQRTSLLKARRAFSNSLAIEETALAYQALGATYHQMGEYKQAEDALKKAIALDPKMLTAYTELAEVHGKIGQFGLVGSVLEQANAQFPDNPFVWLAVGRAFQLTQNSLADAACNGALEIFKSWNQTVQLRALVGASYHDCLFDYDEAYRIFSTIVEEYPDDLDNRLNFSEAALVSGHFDEASDQVSEILTKSTDTQRLSVGEVLILRAIMIAASILQGKIDQAEHEIGQFLKQYMEAPDDFPIFWTFTGTRNFLNQIELQPANRQLLVKLLDLLEAPLIERESKLAEFQQQFENWRLQQG